MCIYIEHIDKFGKSPTKQKAPILVPKVVKWFALDIHTRV